MDKNNDPNIEALEKTLKKLGKLTSKMVLVGGSTTGMHITEDNAAALRKTNDVDLIADVTTGGFYHLSEQLKATGFKEDIDGPICAFKSKEGLLLDVMPIEGNSLGFTNKWYKAAFDSAEPTTLPSGAKISVVRAPEFLACKFEAFADRGNDDYLMSKDMQDIVSVVHGRSEITKEIDQAPEELKSYLVKQFNQLATSKDFKNTLPGLLDYHHQHNVQKITERIKDISELSDTTSKSNSDLKNNTASSPLKIRRKAVAEFMDRNENWIKEDKKAALTHLMKQQGIDGKTLEKDLKAVIWERKNSIKRQEKKLVNIRGNDSFGR